MHTGPVHTHQGGTHPVKASMNPRSHAREKEKIAALIDTLQEQRRAVDQCELRSSRELERLAGYAEVKEGAHKRVAAVFMGTVLAGAAGTLAGLILLPPLGMIVGLGVFLSALELKHQQYIAQYDTESSAAKCTEAETAVAAMRRKKVEIEGRIEARNARIEEIDREIESSARKEVESWVQALDAGAPGSEIQETDDFIMIDSIKLRKNRHCAGVATLLR